MIIEGEVSNGFHSIPITSTWAHSPDDPLVVTAHFRAGGSGQEVIWSFSLDLLLEAFTAPDEGLHGSGDVLVEVGENFTLIHLSNGGESASLKFSTADVESFLEGLDVPSSDEVIASKLDEFLETL